MPRVLESLNLDFNGVCYTGEIILYNGMLDHKILLADFFRHARICTQCSAVIDKSTKELKLTEITSMLKGFFL